MLKSLLKKSLTLCLTGGVLISATPAMAQNTQNTYFNPFVPQPLYQSPQQIYSPASTGTSLPKVSINNLIPPQHFPVGRPNLTCVIEAAQRRNIPVDVMLGVQSVERGETGQQVRNTNATHDMGAFQINTIHLPRIAQLGGSKDDVLKRGCFNAEVASLLLHEAITHPKKQNEDFYTRASGYHSWTPKHNRVYRNKLIDYTRQWQAWMKNNNLGHLVSAPRL